MRRATIAFAATLAVGLTVLAVLALTRGSALVYTIGVQPQVPVTRLAANARACQAPLLPPRDEPIERIGFNVSGGERVEMSLIDEQGRTIARGSARPPAPPPTGRAPGLTAADVAAVRPRGPVTACVANDGSQPVTIWGTIDAASGDTTGRQDGKPIGADMAVVLERREERSLLALAPEMAVRASLFRARWLSPVAYGVLALLVLVGVPALLLGALRSAARP
jgi:hypothetical protein